MKRPLIIIASIAIALTIVLFLHDYIYDKPAVPYTTSQTLTEILTIGPLFAIVIFTVLFLPYLIYKGVRSGK